MSITQVEEPQERTEPPKKPAKKGKQSLHPEALTRFKEMLLSRRTDIRQRAEGTTGTALKGERSLALEEERKHLVEESTSGDVETLVGVGQRATEVITADKEKAIRDRFTVGSEIREAVLALEAFGKLQLDLAAQYPEYFKLRSNGSLDFDFDSWEEEEMTLRDRRLLPGEERMVLIEEIQQRQQRHNEALLIVREKMGGLVKKFLALPEGRKNLDLLFEGSSEKNMALLLLKTLKKPRGRGSYFIPEEEQPCYEAVLNALVKTFGSIGHEDPAYTAQCVKAERMLVDDHVKPAPSFLEKLECPTPIGHDYDASRDLVNLDKLKIPGLLEKRLEEGSGYGKGTKEEQEKRLVDYACRYIFLTGMKHGMDGLDRDTERAAFLRSVFGYYEARNGRVESHLSDEGAKRVIAAVFESTCRSIKNNRGLTIDLEREIFAETAISSAILEGKWRIVLESIGESIDNSRDKSNYQKKREREVVADVFTHTIVKGLASHWDPEHALYFIEKYRERLQYLVEWRKGKEEKS